MLPGKHDTNQKASLWQCLRKFCARLFFAVAALIGCIALINEIILRRTPQLENRLGGELLRYPWRHGDLLYTRHGCGPPLLLLHGLGMGSSSEEWVANIPALEKSHTVYALDLLGWGLSDRPRHAGVADEYVDQVAHFIEDVIAQPCAIIASSSSCAYAIAAAERLPQLVSKLVLICPAIEGEEESIGQSGAPLEQWRDWLHEALQLPVLGRSVYYVLASRAGIKAFASRHLFYEKSRVDEALVSRYYIAAHQHGAQHSALAFASGLSALDARAAWSRLEIPALLVWGRYALINGLETAPEWLALKPDAQLRVIDDAMLLPHAEQAEHFNRLTLEWLQS